MRITERKLRKIIREVISEDLNEGFIGDFIASKIGDRDYRMLVKLCERLIENIKKDIRFSVDYLQITPDTIKNIIKGKLFIKVGGDDRREQGMPSLRQGRYGYDISSELSDDNNLILSFTKNRRKDCENFVIRVPLEIGNKFLNRPNFELGKVKNIGDHIRQEFFYAIKIKEEDRNRSRQANKDREAAKAEKAKKLGIDRES